MKGERERASRSQSVAPTTSHRRFVQTHLRAEGQTGRGGRDAAVRNNRLVVGHCGARRGSLSWRMQSFSLGKKKIIQDFNQVGLFKTKLWHVKN